MQLACQKNRHEFDVAAGARLFGVAHSEVETASSPFAFQADEGLKNADPAVVAASGVICVELQKQSRNGLKVETAMERFANAS